MIYAAARHDLPTSSAPKVRVRQRDAPVPALSLDRFFDALAHARRRVLVLDYDGTLAPFETDRMAARPYPGVRELLSRIRQQPSARVVFLSGRPAREMHELLMLSPRPEIWGVHGWERMMASGQLLRSILPSPAKTALNRLVALQPQIEALGGRMEQKYGSVAVHWRGLAEDRVGQLRTLLQPFQDSGRARVDAAYAHLEEFDGGAELRARGPNKGTIVRALLREEPRDAVIACLGDDVSDEESFTALGGRGLAVRVVPPQASDAARARPTAAQATLHAPDELLAFLGRWNDTPVSASSSSAVF
jgi:trehalose 6-phosphate phosphatase